MAAAVSSTAVEAAAIAAVEAMIATTVPTATSPAVETVVVSAPVAVATVAVVAASVKAIAIVEAAAIEATSVVAAAEPGTGADEDAAGEVVRPVVAVGRAGVRIVAVVTIGADWRWAVHGTYSNGNANLGLSVSRGEKQNS